MTDEFSKTCRGHTAPWTLDFSPISPISDFFTSRRIKLYYFKLRFGHLSQQENKHTAPGRDEWEMPQTHLCKSVTCAADTSVLRRRVGSDMEPHDVQSARMALMELCPGTKWGEGTGFPEAAFINVPRGLFPKVFSRMQVSLDLGRSQ